MWLKKQIPNIITLCNLFCGCIATLYAVQDHLIAAAFFVVLGIFFDFFDGLAARLLNAQSPLGLQLDSLADMVTSGVVPGITMYQLLVDTVGKPFYVAPSALTSDQIFASFELSYLSLIGLLITLASAYRLAKFNIDTRQTTSFIGLPTPANTLLIMSLPLILKFQSELWLTGFFINTWFLIGLTLLSCYMLNAEIPLFALKFKTWDLKSNVIRYGFLVTSLVLLVFLKFAAIPCIIILYVLLSLCFIKQKQDY